MKVGEKVAWKAAHLAVKSVDKTADCSVEWKADTRVASTAAHWVECSAV